MEMHAGRARRWPENAGMPLPPRSGFPRPLAGWPARALTGRLRRRQRATPTQPDTGPVDLLGDAALRGGEACSWFADLFDCADSARR